MTRGDYSKQKNLVGPRKDVGMIHFGLLSYKIVKKYLHYIDSGNEYAFMNTQSDCFMHA